MSTPYLFQPIEKSQENCVHESVVVENEGSKDDTIEVSNKSLPVNMEDHQVEKKTQDIDIQECEPANTEISREDTIRDVDFQEAEAMNTTNSREDTIRDVDFQEAEVVEKKGSTKDDIQEALVYVNRVLNGLEGQPELISKLFDLMREYRSDRDQEKLKHGLFPLFKSHPEFEIYFQECEAVNTTNSREDTIRDVDFQEAEEAMEKKGSTKDDIQEALVYVNRVLNGLEGQPDLISKFFDLLGEYRSDLDQEKLKHGLFVLFKSHPEYEIEFMQFTIQEPSLVRKNPEYVSSKRDVLKNPLEDIKNRYEDKMFENDMFISRINSAIHNTMTFLAECRRHNKTMDVTRYLSNENVKEIVEKCKVNLKNCKHPQESALSVVDRLKVQLEAAKAKRLKFARDMASEIQKLQNNRRGRNIRYLVS